MKKSNKGSFEFSASSRSRLESITSRREGESRIGEHCSIERTTNTKYVILGINEDIGPRANHGNHGAKHAYHAFLGKFLNMQSNKFINADEIWVAGEINSLTDTDELSELRTLTSELDDFVVSVLNELNIEQLKLIVIGGGHNNAYPIMKHFHDSNNWLHILNVDPHADCRALEGRHSGNPFSTAIQQDLVRSYNVFGLHQLYNNTEIYDFLDKNKCFYSFYENYLESSESFADDIEEVLQSINNEPFGLEIDLDSIAMMPTSAFTPSGFSLDEIRSFMRGIATFKPTYLHLPEGAPKNQQESSIVGKALAYLVSDFIQKSA